MEVNHQHSVPQWFILFEDHKSSEYSESLIPSSEINLLHIPVYNLSSCNVVFNIPIPPNLSSCASNVLWHSILPWLLSSWGSRAFIVISLRMTSSGRLLRRFIFLDSVCIVCNLFLMLGQPLRIFCFFFYARLTYVHKSEAYLLFDFFRGIWRGEPKAPELSRWYFVQVSTPKTICQGKNSPFTTWKQDSTMWQPPIICHLIMTTPIDRSS